MLDRELDASDYEALRGLDSDNPPGVRGLVDVDIARLPTYMYKEAGSGAGIRCCCSPKQACHDSLFLVSVIVRRAADSSGCPIGGRKNGCVPNTIGCALMLGRRIHVIGLQSLEYSF